jgi:hypothetical protein
VRLPAKTNHKKYCPGECPEEGDSAVGVELDEAVDDEHRTPGISLRTVLPVDDINFRLDNIYFLVKVGDEPTKDHEAQHYVEAKIEGVGLGHEDVDLLCDFGEEEEITTHYQ